MPETTCYTNFLGLSFQIPLLSKNPKKWLSLKLYLSTFFNKRWLPYVRVPPTPLLHNPTDEQPSLPPWKCWAPYAKGSPTHKGSLEESLKIVSANLHRKEPGIVKGMPHLLVSQVINIQNLEFRTNHVRKIFTWTSQTIWPKTMELRPIFHL